MFRILTATEWQHIGHTDTGAGKRDVLQCTVDGAYLVTCTVPNTELDDPGDDFRWEIEQGDHWCMDGIASTRAGVDEEVEDWIMDFG